MSGCVRTSISWLYQTKWMLFCGWCRGRGVAPVNVTVPMIVDFLVHLRRDRGLSISAVKGYRFVLDSVFALKGMDLADSHPISMVIRSFSKSVRPEELRPPAWDITLVLQRLIWAPYKPLQTSDEHFLAQKTLFLLAFASAKRIGSRFPSPLLQVLYRIHRIPPPLLLGLKGLLYRPYQTREQIAMGDCYVPCGWSSVTWTIPLHIVLDVSGCSSLQDVTRRRS